MTDTASAVAPGMIDAKDGTFGREMLSGIAFIRAFETKVHELGKTSPPEVAGSAHLCAGQEVVPLAAMAALRDSDPVIATYRGHGWALASGLDPASVMAELCHRATGINGGRAGSAYFMAPEQRFIGENSIVGAGVPIACGVAMSLVQAGEGNVVIVSIGDGAMNQGSVHEALVFAAYKRLPVILICENNGWSELTPISRIVRVERLARRGLTYGIEGTTVDGTDPLAVRAAVAHAAARARAGEGPALIECKVPRLWGHYNRDIEHYRPREDSREAAARDPLKLWAQRLTASGLMSAAEVDGVIAAEDARVAGLAQAALAAPRLPAAAARDHVFSAPQPPLAAASGQAPRGEAREMSYIGAVNAALRDELAADPRTVVYGEDLGHAGGIFGASKGLQLEFGDSRVFDTPIAESAILGSGVGAAMTGLKPIVEIMWADFMLVALDQLVNQAANVRYVTGGKSSVPMVVRTQQGATPGSCPQHSQSLEALLTHIPGLKVALPATPQDAYDILREAAADPDPCVVIEAQGLYGMKGLVSPGIPAGQPGRARLHREGSDVAIVTWGAMLHQAVDAAAQLAAQGIEASVLDLRWLCPLDEDSLVRTVKRASGRVLIVHEAVRTGGFGGEVAMRVSERLGAEMPLQISRLTTPDVRIPAAPHLQASLIPNAQGIVQEAQRLLKRVAAAA